MRVRDLLLVFLALGGSAELLACEEPPKTALGYTEDAKRAYEAALQEFTAHNWLQAQTLMREVKRKYSYSKFARLAELRIADADYEQEKFPEAIREYKDFIHAHRTDTDEVAYARARIAEATYAGIPDSVLTPAAEERDQATVVEAYKELKAYLTDFPDSKASPHIRELQAQVIARLIRHELYVAGFYLNKDNYDAAVSRIQYALRSYPVGDAPGSGSDLEAEALLLLGQTYLKMHKWDDARQAFETIVHAYGRSPFAVAARNYLDYGKPRGG